MLNLPSQELNIMEMPMVSNKPPSLLPLTLQKLQQSTPLSPLLRFSQTQHQKQETYHLQNLSPSPNTYTSLDQLKQIHGYFIKTHCNPFAPRLSSEAQYNFLITAYIKNNEPKKALNIYAFMRTLDIQVDNFAVPSILKACGQISVTQLGKEIHGFAVKTGLIRDVFVRNALMQMYTECGSLASARLLFDTMGEKDVVSWSTMIRSYSRNRLVHEGLELIKDMLFMNVKPGEAAMVSMVNLSADLEHIELGKAMHAYVLRKSNDEKLGVALISSLIDMYAKCGNLVSARILFNGLTEKDIVSWTALIAGYIRSNNLEEGERLFVKMVEESIVPNEITILSVIIACGFVRAIQLGKRLHAYILRSGSRKSMALTTALVDMYGKFGDLRSARVLFDSMDNKDVMTWSAMITAYAQAQCSDNAFDLFVQMRDGQVKPNGVTMVSLLSLCAEAGSLDMGKWIHAYIDKQGVKVDVVLKTALVDMYAKCGDINGSERLFSEAVFRDICMWNAMMAGYGMHGWGDKALKLFAEMERLGIKPDDVTFISVLNACSHAGLVEEGKRLFERMVHDFSLIPKAEHYGCMVDLLGRAGLLDEAYEMIESMPIKSNITIWGALLAACKIHKNPDMGELVAKKLLALEPQNCGYNILMSNIYAAANRWNDVAGVRKALKDIGVKKAPGLSSIEVNGSVHDFSMGDMSHPQIERISDMLTELSKKLKEAGYMPDTFAVL